MTPKEYLSQIRKINIMIDCKQHEIQSLYDLITSTTPKYESDPVQSGSTSDKIGNVICKITDLQSEINSDIDRLVNLKSKIFKQIQELDIIEFAVLHKRYFEFKTWEIISKEMMYSERQIYRIHGEALNHIKDVSQCQ